MVWVVVGLSGLYLRLEAHLQIIWPPRYIAKVTNSLRSETQRWYVFLKYSCGFAVFLPEGSVLDDNFVGIKHCWIDGPAEPFNMTFPTTT